MTHTQYHPHDVPTPEPDEEVDAVDIAFEPRNASVVYAAMGRPAAAPAGEVEDEYTFGTASPIPRTRSTPKVGRNDPCP